MQDMILRHFTVKAVLDTEANWWVATSDDVPGLATGAATLEELISKLAVMIPELLELNEVDLTDDDDDFVTVSYSIMAEATGQARVRRAT